ncbi:NAD(FAD)-dependent dehydrogenase [Lactococcus hodotermopsidis]|uniref:NAD(FAD)-dependent dehydrogenase n=1 Tax=Pseudolactococcus hodotermopsidis TaxID=2709157 RepID=A0A6A0BGQ3_9LACT|nr:FAD-dependent oxidoreductase [Lactococcus hodotermopsidis]GFH43451.1 NAD(FAD)-dependent dehydrogenase [Lactococcus hodotermopsidis]
MKVVIVGASHGGHQSALELLDKYEGADVTIYEKGDFISFLSCGMQLFLEDKVTDVDDVRNFRPEDIEKRGGKVKAQHEVLTFDATKKEVTVKNLATDDVFVDTYDKLILSSGVTPAALPVVGTELENVFFMRGRAWALKIKEKLENKDVKNVVVIGSGYIGVEAAEVFAEAGKKVTIIDMIDDVLGNYLDKELTDILAPVFEKNGVALELGAKITGLTGDTAVTGVETSNGTIAADLVIVAAGVTPNTAWLKGLVDLEERGQIKVDDYLRTSAKDVYAVGDAILPLNLASQTHTPVALASTARREARYVVRNIENNVPTEKFRGVLGTSALTVFGYKFAMTGLNNFSAARSDVKIAGHFFKDTLRPTFVKNDGNTDIFVKLNFDETTHKILGGQVMSTYDVTAQINTLALAITAGMTLEELAEADFFFQPGLDRQWSMLNLAAQAALGETKF